MVRHQAMRMAHPIEPVHHLRNNTQELRAIVIVFKDRCTTIIARGYVLKRADEFNARAWP
jgi:hypothetical protein